MWERFLTLFENVGFDPDDSDETRLQKRLLVAVSGLISSFGVLWAMIYLALGEPLAALIPGGYAALSLVNILVFSRTGRYEMFRTTQLLLIVTLPFLLQMVLGGFVGGSAVIIWALMAPLGALVIQGRRVAVRYMVGFGVLLVASLIIQPSLEIENNLSPPVVGLFFLLNLLAASLVAFIVLNYFVGQRDRIQAELSAEQAKSDRLLLNILPEEVAADLKEDGRTEAKKFNSASVLFADLVGFTVFADRVSPDELVATLNEIFTRFDEIADRHGVEKIRTIGDSYMAACGVPVERSDHADVIARAALEMIEYVDRHQDVDFRIGINSGSLVAGVVGTKKFQYDIWGDTVNTASRMESSGEPEKIQVSEATYDLIRDRFILTSRGPVQVKGKGEMTTWYLVGERE